MLEVEGGSCDVSGGVEGGTSNGVEVESNLTRPHYPH